MNQLPIENRARILSCLVEGVSIRATARLCGVAINTVVKLQIEAGQACSEYQDGAFRNLTCKRIECDEIWSFCYAKEKNVPEDKRGQFGYGDVWTWTAIDAETKLIPCWLVGNRNTGAAVEFMHDLASRLTHRVQLTTDAHKPYLVAVESAFAGDVDYAQLVKIFEDGSRGGRSSPPKCTGTKVSVVTGKPQSGGISTSYVERQNLTMRMGMRRFTRLTNGFSKKVENHGHALALYFMHYNFCRIHTTLRVTPAMQAGVADQVWEMTDVVRMMDSMSQEKAA